uniref:Glycosyltransferase n=1 Tax=Angelica decursiva TaxID=52491 RepID=A0A9E8G861_9APIA|nr:2-hydroxyflavanone C-glucosyltransferase [Angelica decursiva]
MSSSSSRQSLQPHIALFPTAGMGHLTPFLRVAAMLASYNVTVTVITAQPTLSAAESDTIASFFAIHPQIKRLDFHIVPYNSPTPDDPFFIHWEATNRSLHLLHPLISTSSPPLTAIFSDFGLATNMIPIADRLQIPTFILLTTSARFLSVMANYPFPELSDTDANHIQIPGLTNIPKSSIPPQLLRPDKSIFASTLASTVSSFSKVKGILLNSFEYFESETIIAFNNGQVQPGFPPVLPIGPIAPYGLVQGDHPLPWLNDQPAKSVVYISFGSRTAMSKDQIRALGDGLDRSGHRFLWVLKGNKVDKEDKEALDELLSNSFLERTKNKGIVVKGWVSQEDILQHPAVGGFVSHCGWNSVTEAALHGVPMLAWPLNGDQRINAGVVEKSGLGLWEREWGWAGEKLINEQEIAEKVKVIMEDEILRAKASNVGKEARKAVGKDGGSEKVLAQVINSLNPKGRE